ncbi:MAG TPA: acylglycerol kinase family protein, partial [Pyrinomonadaceae bacterium]|nr:acylglycerol kinase family protein [Pyrinomonadaceae bacterium]
MNKKERKVERGTRAEGARDDITADAATPDVATAAPSSSTAAPSSLIPHPSSLIPPASSLPLVIVNPASSGGATGRRWPRLASDLRAHFGAFNCAFTERAGDASVIAEREAGAGRSLLIACGGDGTISEVANGILASGADAELGILPSGTGGDFRRTLDLSKRGADAAA